MRFFVKLFVILLTSGFISNSAIAQDSLNISLIGRISNDWRSAKDVVITDDYAFVSTSYNGIYIVDISDPTAPEKVAEYPISAFCYDLALEDNVLYVIALQWDDPPTQSGLYILDVSDPLNITQVSHHFGGGRYLSLQDTVIAKAYGNEVILIDVSEPEDPHEIVEYDFEYEILYDNIVGIQIQDTLLITAHYDSDLRILDISDPFNPVEIGALETSELFTYGISAVDTFACLVDDDFGLTIADIRNPEDPQVISQLEIEWEIHDISIHENFAYLSPEDHEGGSRGVLIVDINDLYNPEEIALIPSTAHLYDRGIQFTDSTMIYCDDEEGLRIYDITDPADPFEIGYTDRPDGAVNIEAANDTLFVLGRYKIWTVDYSFPHMPTALGYVRTPRYYDCSNMILDGNHLWMTTYSDSALLQFDITDVLNPVCTDTIIVGCEGTRDLFFHNNTMYLAGDNRLYIFDISDPENTVIADSLEFPERIISSVDGFDNILYVLDRGVDPARILIYNIENPFAPELVSTTNIDIHHPFELNVRENHLYVTSTFSILKFDVSNPESPDILGQFYSSNESNIHASNFWDNFVIYSQNFPYYGLFLVDMTSTDSSYWSVKGYYREYYQSYNAIEVIDNLIIGDLSFFVPSSELELQETKPTPIPSLFSVGSPYPNPFNSRVHFSISVPSTGEVTFSLINILGREFVNWKQYLSDGKQNITVFLGDRSLPSSGQYFLSASYGNQTVVHKVIFLK